MAASGGAHRAPSLSPPLLRLLGKPDCGLCHEMRDVARVALAGLSVQLVEVDVREDPELERRYLLEIPVLLLGEAEIARHRTTPEELRRKLAAAGFTPSP